METTTPETGMGSGHSIENDAPCEECQFHCRDFARETDNGRLPIPKHSPTCSKNPDGVFNVFKAAPMDAYTERNYCVSVIAKMAHSMGWCVGIRKTEIEGWDECWHNCVFIDFPDGQASWHYHDSDAHLFQDLPAYEKEWDGHSTEGKYQMLRRLRLKAGV